MQVLTTDEFSAWFHTLDDRWAEDVATAIDVIERLGPARAAPGSSEYLLWYEHPPLQSTTRKGGARSPHGLEEWGAFRDYVGKVLAHLQSERFFGRLAELGIAEVDLVLRAVERIKYITSPRWILEAVAKGTHFTTLQEQHDEVRRVYFEVLAAAGFELADVPAHSRALRELSRRPPGFRLLYGIDTRRDTALIVLGEKLDRSFYGDSVRRAETAWTLYLDGDIQARNRP